MNILKQARKDFNKYKEYIIYSTKSELKVQLSSTYLGYLWWILDPLMYMLVYMLVVMVIFRTSQDKFPIFVFCALLPWKWTTSSILEATNSIKSKVTILQQVYLPKYILPLIRILINTVKFFFGIIVLFILMILLDVGFNVHNFEFLIIIAVNFTFILSVSLILSHYGVYFRDINNILSFTIRLWFYLSPGLYNLDRVPESVRFLWWINPMTTFYESYRNVFLYNASPLYMQLGIWLVASLLLMIVGLKILYKHDKNYTKVV